MIPVSVPPLGESIVEATVSRWTKRAGDSVIAGETLVELETDKVTVEVPALKAGVLAQVLRAEGDVVKVGDVLGELDDAAATSVAPPVVVAPAVAPPAMTPLPSPPIPTVAAAPAPASAAPRAPAPMTPPSAGPSVPVPEFRVSPAAARVATDLSIDLATVTGSGRGGVISKPDVLEASTRIAAAPVVPPVIPPVVPPVLAAAVVPPAIAPVVPPMTAGELPAATSASREVPPPPTVAGPLPVPPAQAEQPVSAPRPAVPTVATPSSNAVVDAARETREKMTTRRRRIAEHLLESQHATAHLTTFNEIDMSAVEALRARVNPRLEKDQGLKLSMMPFFVRAACQALKQFPVVNARLDGDHIVYHHYVNVGIAVASEAGLVVPNVKDADQLGMTGIAKAIGAVAKKARDGKLTMDDLTGGTFTITNGGVFGSLVSTPIINYPQVAILGLHKVQDRPVVVNGDIVVRPMMYVALSYDHRLIDGQHAVLFLVRLKELMEDPALLAVE